MEAIFIHMCFTTGWISLKKRLNQHGQLNRGLDFIQDHRTISLTHKRVLKKLK